MHALQPLAPGHRRQRLGAELPTVGRRHLASAYRKLWRLPAGAVVPAVDADCHDPARGAFFPPAWGARSVSELCPGHLDGAGPGRTEGPTGTGGTLSGWRSLARRGVCLHGRVPDHEPRRPSPDLRQRTPGTRRWLRATDRQDHRRIAADTFSPGQPRGLAHGGRSRCCRPASPLPCQHCVLPGDFLRSPTVGDDRSGPACRYRRGTDPGLCPRLAGHSLLPAPR
ncbi:hypothetical protein D3C81_1533170 [compost metagenome]